MRVGLFHPVLPGARQTSREFAGLGALVVAAALSLVAVLMLIRRLAGGLNTPPNGPLLAGVGVLLAMAAGWLRFAARDAVAAVVSPAACWLLRGLPSAALVVIGLVACVPGTAPLAALAYWLAVVAEESIAWRMTLRAPRSASRGVATHGRSASQTPRLTQPHAAASDSFSQHIVRRRTSDGAELIVAEAWSELSPGQRTAWIHIAFCPPLGGAPQVVVEQIEGPPCRTQLGPILPQGVRCEVRCQEAGPARVGVKIVARFPSAAEQDDA